MQVECLAVDIRLACDVADRYLRVVRRRNEGSESCFYGGARLEAAAIDVLLLISLNACYGSSAFSRMRLRFPCFRSSCPSSFSRKLTF